MRDPFIIDPDYDSSKDCETCNGSGLLHKSPSFGRGWESCLQRQVGGRCCDWKTKECPDCKGTGKKETP